MAGISGAPVTTAPGIKMLPGGNVNGPPRSTFNGPTPAGPPMNGSPLQGISGPGAPTGSQMSPLNSTPGLQHPAVVQQYAAMQAQHNANAQALQSAAQQHALNGAVLAAHPGAPSATIGSVYAQQNPLTGAQFLQGMAHASPTNQAYIQNIARLQNGGKLPGLPGAPAAGGSVGAPGQPTSPNTSGFATQLPSADQIKILQAQQAAGSKYQTAAAQNQYKAALERAAIFPHLQYMGHQDELARQQEMAALNERGLGWGNGVGGQGLGNLIGTQANNYATYVQGQGNALAGTGLTGQQLMNNYYYGLQNLQNQKGTALNAFAQKTIKA